MAFLFIVIFWTRLYIQSIRVCQLIKWCAKSWKFHIVPTWSFWKPCEPNQIFKKTFGTLLNKVDTPYYPPSSVPSCFSNVQGLLFVVVSRSSCLASSCTVGLFFPFARWCSLHTCPRVKGQNKGYLTSHIFNPFGKGAHSVENIVAEITFQFWVISINFEEFWTIFGNFWQFLEIFDKFWTIFGHFNIIVQGYLSHYIFHTVLMTWFVPLNISYYWNIN